MNNRRPGRRGWGPWIVAGILVLLLAGLDQGGVLVALALVTGVLGIALLFWRSQRRRGAGMVATALVALLVGGAVLDAPAEQPPAASTTAPAATPSAAAPTAATPSPTEQTQESPSPATETSPSASAASDSPSAAPSPDRGEDAPDEARSAVDVLALLEVKGRAAKTGYDRDAFAYREVDVDRNGCDTRNDVLNRDLQARTHRSGTGGCVVLTGMLADPYSGEWIAFVRGTGTSSEVQIDHVVALSDAWQKGAQGWDAATLAQFGNDPLNLLAVSGPLNAQKGDGDAATWLPPDRSYWCPYVARQVAVKHAYDLWVTKAEHDAMARVLASCPEQPLPSGSEPGQPPATNVPTPPPAEPATQAPPSPSSPGAEVPGEPYYANCTEVRAAGAAPIRAGDPGWSPRFDGDGDGVGCE
ncbi:GmrSD restriction endonuclease domain-containing protein [Ruania albidiflava]|uniref:GmrSD restriction endonuclease domain-containing protein n=1 Tax=Ruania albidiflava TaxID=366586 RepID=UPI0003FA48D0|nr:DUF1524 domain-containing protein [Ruania albidiflava]